MQGDDPPYLPVGTAVSAKYKGAFCEAKVSKVVRVVKCKVTYKMGLGTATVSDEQIKGPLRVGQLVQAKHLERKEYVDATITKIQDCSQYTVVFDDGDITTLRRTALCLKSGRHFNESETLDQLPLTHPEHFGNPVVGGRRGRRSRQAKEDSSEGEAEEENEPDLEAYIMEVGRVVCVEASDKKRNKDNWFPGLVVMPSAQPTVRINVKDEFLVRSFKDGRYYTVPQKEVTEFSRSMISKIESPLLTEAVEKAVRYLDNDELPVHWERSLLLHNSNQNASSDSEEHYTDSSDDETPEEKDHFVAQLYKFMDDSNTPLNKNPSIGSKDVDLHRLFRVVRKLGGYNRVTNKNKWRSVTLRMKLPNNLNTYNQVKLVYKKCLLSYEAFHRTLGVTMLNHPRNAKKSRGRSLIRDRDRSTPVNSPKPEKEEEMIPIEKKEEEKPEDKPKVTKKFDFKKEEEKKPKEIDISDTNSSDTTDVSEATTNVSVRLRRAESKSSKERKPKPATGEKVKAIVEKFEEQAKKEEKQEKDNDEKRESDKGQQQTRSKTQVPKVKEKEKEKEASPDKKPREVKTPETPTPIKTPTKPQKKEEDKKRGRKKTTAEDRDKASQSDSSLTDSSTTVTVGIGDKLKVYYGPTHESKVTYEAKVIEIDKEAVNPMYLVHYTGWNTRYDEWITPVRIAENLSATTKAKKLKQGGASTSKTSTPKASAKRGRRMSITGRSTAQEGPRSTTPSGIPTPASTRTKSPGTPATRTSRTTRQGDQNRRTRRTSAQTDVSNHSESESEVTESDSETVKTRSGLKSEDAETRVKKKLIKTKPDKRKEKDDEETEKEDETTDKPDRPKRTRKVKKLSDSKPESDEDGSPPKGRDFDLNQIRSELKGFAVKPVKSSETEKEALLSDESNQDAKPFTELSEVEKPKETSIQKSLSSDDIYEFKEPEPFEFETRKLVDEKTKKRLVPRIFDEVDKSPKKRKPGSPARIDKDEDAEKKRLRRTPVKRARSSDDEDEMSDESLRKLIEDPFDKLVESPSFHSGREKITDNKSSIRPLNLDEPLSLFHGLSETAEDDSGDQLDISDTEESQNEPLFTHKEQLFTEDTFAKASPDRTALDPIFRGFIAKNDRKQKDSDDDDAIRASIQNAINQTSSTDDDSNDVMLINPPHTQFTSICFAENQAEVKTKTSTITLSSTESEDDLRPVEISSAKNEPKEIKKETPTSVTQISPALQETDSTLLEEAISNASQSEILTKLDETKDINVKTGTKIADTLLQKFSMINKSPEKKDTDEDKPKTLKPESKVEEEVKKIEQKVKMETKLKQDVKPKVEAKKPEPKNKSPENRFKTDSKLKQEKPKPSKTELENKKRARKILSREFIEESDTDSTDSEERLVIARSDEESQTNSSADTKPDTKECNSNSATEEPQVPENPFKFEPIKKPEFDIKVEPKTEPEIKEEEPDSHLHSLLLCEETIPGSPAPAPEGPNVIENKPKNKSILEMPFASAPGSSNNKTEVLPRENKVVSKERIQPPPLVLPMDNRDKEGRETSTVLDNTPPTTPESTLSNLSPRGDPEDLSPNTAEDSCKSGDGENDYSIQRRGSASKMLSYTDDGTLDQLPATESSSTTKKSLDITASPCRKRRRSCKGTEDTPAKRGRKPINRSRHNSDSDDTSEHSMSSGLNLLSSSIDGRVTRSPKPSKINYFIELDPSLDSAQRIAILQQKLQEIRKTYADVKAELAAVERRRKKLRRREREAKLAAKQESLAT